MGAKDDRWLQKKLMNMALWSGAATSDFTWRGQTYTANEILQIYSRPIGNVYKQEFLHPRPPV
jgi:hypothetical protein